MAYSKLDSGITKSSIWSEAHHVRVVWVSFLASKDADGMVKGSRTGLIRMCNVTAEEYDEATEILRSPDLESQNPDNAGRRIEKVPGGWMVLNHEHYRLPEDQKRVATRERVRRWREKQKEKGADKQAAQKTATEKNWRTNFDIYKAEHDAAVEALLQDPQWIAERQEYHPRLDIRLSLQKAARDYWGTKAGWAKKTAARKTKEIDWRRTYNNALTMRCNQVWRSDRPDDDDDPQPEYLTRDL